MNSAKINGSSMKVNKKQPVFPKLKQEYTPLESNTAQNIALGIVGTASLALIIFGLMGWYS